MLVYAMPYNEERSPLVRGAWIETLLRGLSQPPRVSPPVRGAWIETKEEDELPPGLRSPPVRGAWIETVCKGLFAAILRVSPRAGGVD